MPDLRQQGLAGLGQLFLLGLGLGEVLALGGKVGLDLRLGAGGTHDNRRAAFQRVDQDVGGGQAGLLTVTVPLLLPSPETVLNSVLQAHLPTVPHQ